MNGFCITFSSGQSFTVSAEAGNPIQQSMMNNGPRALSVDVGEERSLFISIDHVESIEVIVVSEAAAAAQ